MYIHNKQFYIHTVYHVRLCILKLITSTNVLQSIFETIFKKFICKCLPLMLKLLLNIHLRKSVQMDELFAKSFGV